ncbi:MAG: dethiobiotin synthase [Epsilonproteobacteria bacterium]|nr:dethiobiotin synthase [Campylobacterota bacterium]
MGKKLFITATNTNVGKTYTTLELFKIALKKGLKPLAIKPIETGEICADGLQLLEECKKIDPSLTLKDIVVYHFPLPAAPYVAKGDKKIEIEKILDRIEALAQKSDLLLIEGAGGLMVPIEREFFIIDLIKLTAPALLVTPSKLGCINDTLLSMEALKRRGIKFSWYVNLYQDRDSFFKVTYPFYKDYFKEVPLDLELVFNSYPHWD